MPVIDPGKHLFVVDLHYLVPLETVDRHRDAHVAFLKECYTAGQFLASGPKVPREGGVIIAISESKEALEEVLTHDPFHQHGIARYTLTEFQPVMTAKALA